jgi:hypothetical protein
MKEKRITVDDVIEFAAANVGKPLVTLSRNSPFTVGPNKTGIRYELPSGAYWPVSRDLVALYLKSYNKSAAKDREKTTIYPPNFRERSYMVSMFAHIAKVKLTSSGKAKDGLNDLDDIPAGNATPDRASATSWFVVRDAKVRAYVLKQAKGKCEYCGSKGFLMKNGLRYLEAHHVISLSTKGKDTVDNVIALCPFHHREAHFGQNADALEEEFLARISKRNAMPNKASELT